MLALIFTRKLRPMIIGSSSGWLMLAGMIARPRATSSRTNSGATLSRSATKRISSVMIAAPRVVHLRAVAASPSREPRVDPRLRAASAGPCVQVVALRARRVVDVERRLAAARWMRRTGTRMSPSVRNTCSDAGSSGSGASPSTGSTIVVSDRLPLPRRSPCRCPRPFAPLPFFISPRFSFAGITRIRFRGRAVPFGGASQPADRTSAQLPQLCPRANVSVAAQLQSATRAIATGAAQASRIN